MEFSRNYYHAIVCYDGTKYFGWQETIAGPSIQSSLKKALYNISGENVIPEAASRTDRGVHAKGQSVCFSLEKHWDESRLLKALNAHLKEDIRVLKVSFTSASFHPTVDAKAKIYQYVVSTDSFQLPQDRLYSWHVPQKLNLDLLHDAAKTMIGFHDFSAFSTEIPKNPFCNLFNCELLFDQNKIIIQMIGDRFIYKMARTIAGTCIFAARSKISIDQINHLFTNPCRANAGMTAPSHGLFLLEVLY